MFNFESLTVQRFAEGLQTEILPGRSLNAFATRTNSALSYSLFYPGRNASYYRFPKPCFSKSAHKESPDHNLIVQFVMSTEMSMFLLLLLGN